MRWLARFGAASAAGRAVPSASHAAALPSARTRTASSPRPPTRLSARAPWRTITAVTATGLARQLSTSAAAHAAAAAARTVAKADVAAMLERQHRASFAAALQSGQLGKALSSYAHLRAPPAAPPSPTQMLALMTLMAQPQHRAHEATARFLRGVLDDWTARCLASDADADALFADADALVAVPAASTTDVADAPTPLRLAGAWLLDGLQLPRDHVSPQLLHVLVRFLVHDQWDPSVWRLWSLVERAQLPTLPLPDTYLAVIAFATRTGATDRALDLFRQLEDRVVPQLAADPALRTTHALTEATRAQLWRWLLAALGRARAPSDDLAGVFRGLVRNDVLPSLAVFDAYLYALKQARDLPAMERLWGLMVATPLRDGRGFIRPSAKTYGTMLTAYAQAKRTEDVERLLQMMRAEAEDPRRRHVAQPTTFIHNILLRLYAETGRYADAETVFHSMAQQGLVPDHVTYSTMMGMYGAQGKTDAVAATLAASIADAGAGAGSAARVSPKTWSAALAAYRAIGTPAALARFDATVRQMDAAGVAPIESHFVHRLRVHPVADADAAVAARALDRACAEVDALVRAGDRVTPRARLVQYAMALLAWRAYRERPDDAARRIVGAVQPLLALAGPWRLDVLALRRFVFRTLLLGPARPPPRLAAVLNAAERRRLAPADGGAAAHVDEPLFAPIADAVAAWTAADPAAAGDPDALRALIAAIRNRLMAARHARLTAATAAAHDDAAIAAMGGAVFEAATDPCPVDRATAAAWARALQTVWAPFQAAPPAAMPSGTDAGSERDRAPWIRGRAGDTPVTSEERAVLAAEVGELMATLAPDAAAAAAAAPETASL
ncbi:hypothetical protein CXG81DRAFT_27056 [Caulochytrium protostelioides]|uniref:Pentacotripeptide-repeat region of PRORP domain-containing protein n=1 Tax=Caulochytrium protostelioides TaxID=1555241 RepID=A0A4P9X538_9FUNG|nr:hypothetical protein CXG81DRAFT_27056 [Caulochytrium protostelioides]|eukprot:RKP00237.1 hypothetical protein CXG81DRAFT_27056 [Caulochytrium protostelioides]